MHTLNFDEAGYIVPYDLVDVDMADLEEYLVFSHKRASIFSEFKSLLEDFANEQIKVDEIWIDGSFSSLNPNPRDMDLICFVEPQCYDRLQNTLIGLKQKYSLLDIYFVKEYPAHDAQYFLTKFDRLDWLHFFSRDRLNRKKGILKLMINYEAI